MDLIAADTGVISECGEGTLLKLGSIVKRIVSLAFTHRDDRRLRMREMLSLGDKRFIAIVEYGQEKFLIAGTPQNISLLRQYDGTCEGMEKALRRGTDLG